MTNALIEQLLQQRFGNDPQMQALMTMFQQQQVIEAEYEIKEPDTKPVSEEVAQNKDKLDKARRHIYKLRQRIARLEMQLDQVEETEEEMALALGACVDCWGEDPDCRQCYGKGTSGYLPPDPGRFQRLILPAVKRMNPPDSNPN